MKRRPKLVFSFLLLSSIEHKSFTLTTQPQHKIMLEDEISPLSSFSLEDSKKKEAEGHL